MRDNITKILSENKKIVLGVVVVITFIFASLLLFKNDIPSYRATAINEIPIVDTVLLKDPYLYAYNGLSFHKTNIYTSDITVLNSGLKLPSVETIIWANDNGALMTFDESFWLSEPQSVMLDSGRDILDSSYKDYTWYLDFETSKLSPVHTEKILPNIGFYSPSRNSIIFAAMTNGSQDVSLLSYSPSSEKTEAINERLDVFNIRDISDCGENSSSICLLARTRENPDSTSVIEVNSIGVERIALSSRGRVFETNRMNHYVVFEKIDFDVGDSGFNFVNNSDTAESEANVVNISDGTVLETNYSTNSNNVIVHYVQDEGVIFFDDSVIAEDGVFSYFYGVVEDGNVSVAKMNINTNNKLNDIVTIRTVDESNSILGILPDNTPLLLHQTTQNIKLPEPTEEITAREVVLKCLSEESSSLDYDGNNRTFRIFFIENNDFSDNVNRFSSCLLEEDKSIIFGFNFYFGARDSVSGRITTD